MRFLSALSILMLIGGCDAPPDDQIIPELGDGKADFSGQAEDKGEMVFGEAIEGEFGADFEYHAFRIEAEAGAVFTLDVTQLGTAAALATVLVLYGPSGEEGERERLTHDFDSGWGDHSRISQFSAEERGAYIAVLGTADGFGRGSYRLLLECENDQCSAPIGPITLQENDPNTEFLETFSTVPEEWSEYCYGVGSAYTYPTETGAVTTDQAADAIARIFNEFNDLYDEDEALNGGEVSDAGFNRWLGDSYGFTQSTFDNAVGYFDEEYEINRIDYDFECAASVNCGGTIMVIHYTERREVFTVEFGCGDE